MSGVRMLHFFERLMEMHSNPPILYYGFNSILNLDVQYNAVYPVLAVAKNHRTILYMGREINYTLSLPS